MAKRSASESSAGTKKYDVTREFKSMVNSNVDFYLDTLDAIGDNVIGVVDGAMDSASNLASDAGGLVSDVVRQGKKAYRDSVSMLRKQARRNLGN